jgi:hypothetical protein
MTRCTCHDTLVVKDLRRWFKEKWVDVSRTEDGKHPPCGRSKANTSSKGYPKCRPSVRVSNKTPKTSGEMSSGQKKAATQRKRAKKQGVGGKPTIVKQVTTDMVWPLLKKEPFYQQLRNNFILNPDDESDDSLGEYPTDDFLQWAGEHYTRLHEDENHPEEYYNLLEAIELEKKRRREGSFDGIGYNEETAFTRSEPMDMAWRLLKTPVSPEAKRHKIEYDKKYESNPERVKYREELNAERRKRGIYGHGGPDMSHTKNHTLVAESPHANRARHFKERGTLKGQVAVVKALGDEGYGGRKVQCPKCERYFYGENGLNNHNCQKPINFNAPISPEEKRDLYQFIMGYANDKPSGDENCPACQGKGEIDGDPCPLCRGG